INDMKKPKSKLGYRGNYGLELIIDMKGCDLSDLSRNKLKKFFVELCDHIDMTRHGNPIFWENKSGVPHLDGISGFQFIETSNVVCHPLPLLKAVYLNIFSCKKFDTSDALKFCKKYWGATSTIHTVVTRV
ncbi:MAG: hypothetical protein UU67_C0073G0009, partial [Candidatus Daviesbacteria bacterium GW2011_GWB1_41_5]